MIVFAAFYQACPCCGRHGRIILPGGEKSREFCSVEDATVVANELLTNGKICREEQEFLLHCIREDQYISSTEDRVDNFTRGACELINSTVKRTEAPTDDDSLKKAHHVM